MFKFKSLNNVNNKITYLLFIFVFFSSVSLFYFIFFSYKYLFFNSDSATKVLLAKEIFQTGLYFPKDWVYVNGDLFVLFGHTFIIPLLNFVPAGFFAHALSGLFSTLLIFISLNLLIDLLKINLNRKLLVNFIILGGISLPMTEHIFGQVSYGYNIYMLCFILWSSYNILTNPHKSNNIYCFIFLLLISLSFWSNPKRAIVIVGLPLFISSFFLVQHEKYLNRINGISIKYFSILLFSIILGFFLHKLTLNHVTMEIGYTNLVWLNITEITERFLKLIGGIFFLLGGEPLKNRNIISSAGIYETIRILSAIGFFYLIPSTLRMVYASKNKSHIFLSDFAISSFLITSFFLVFTNLFDERYLIPSLFLFLILFFSYNSKFNRSFCKSSFLKIIVIFGIASNTFVINSTYWNTYNLITARRVNYPIYNGFPNLKDVLIAHNLYFGYATYWRASLLTVLSDEKITTRSINIIDGLPRPHYYLGAMSWYKCINQLDKVFLILTPEELKSLNLNSLKNFGLEPIQTISINYFTILVFNKNFCNLPDWPKSTN